jgi:hypothetical protein
MTDKIIRKAIKNFLIKKENKKITEIVIDKILYINNSYGDKCYIVDYQMKYFDGGGYMWGNKKLSITLNELSPYLLDEYIFKGIKKYLKTKATDVDIHCISKENDQYLIKYQRKYFDGGGYRWTDVIEFSLPQKEVEKNLRKEKLKRITNNINDND